MKPNSPANLQRANKIGSDYNIKSKNTTLTAPFVASELTLPEIKALLTKNFSPIKRNILKMVENTTHKNNYHVMPTEVIVNIDNSSVVPSRVTIATPQSQISSDILMLIDEEQLNYRDLFESDTYGNDEIYGIRVNLSLSDYVGIEDTDVDDKYSEFFKVTSKDYSENPLNYDEAMSALTDEAYSKVNEARLSAHDLDIAYFSSPTERSVDYTYDSEARLTQMLRSITEEADLGDALDNQEIKTHARLTNKIVVSSYNDHKTVESSDLINVDADSESAEISAILSTEQHNHSKENIYFESLAFIGVQDADESDDSEIYEAMSGPLFEESVTQWKASRRTSDILSNLIPVKDRDYLRRRVLDNPLSQTSFASDSESGIVLADFRITNFDSRQDYQIERNLNRSLLSSVIIQNYDRGVVSNTKFPYGNIKSISLAPNPITPRVYTLPKTFKALPSNYCSNYIEEKLLTRPSRTALVALSDDTKSHLNSPFYYTQLKKTILKNNLLVDTVDKLYPSFNSHLKLDSIVRKLPIINNKYSNYLHGNEPRITGDIPYTIDSQAPNLANYKTYEITPSNVFELTDLPVNPIIAINNDTVQLSSSLHQLTYTSDSLAAGLLTELGNPVYINLDNIAHYDDITNTSIPFNPSASLTVSIQDSELFYTPTSNDAIYDVVAILDHKNTVPFIFDVSNGCHYIVNPETSTVIPVTFSDSGIPLVSILD